MREARADKVKRRVLVVDDDTKVTLAVSLYLRADGYDVTTLNDSTKALACIRAVSPDVVLLDMMMPEVSGIELCKAIRADSELNDLPVMFVSAIDDQMDKLAALEIANDYVVKPFDVKELTARVNKAIRVKDLQDQLKKKNEELRALVLVDEETGLFGRNYLVERLGEEMARAKRYFYSIACLLVEINEAEQLQAELPRAQWIALMQEFAWTLRDGLRMADLVTRYGEGSFFALLPSTDTAGARIVADGIVTALQSKMFVPDLNLKTTVSIGIASLGPNELPDRHALLSRAEAALKSARSRRENPIVEG